jgi:hypothetical protein
MQQNIVCATVQSYTVYILTVLRIRIRIRMFLGIPDPYLDPDPLVPGADHQAKIVRKNLDSYCFVTTF